MADRFLYILICVILTIGCSNAQRFHANTRYGKRSDVVEGERTKTESGTRESRNQSKLEVSPRNDRFFLGSRYGKRTPSINSDESVESSHAEHSWNQMNQPSIRNDRFFIGSRYGKRDHPFKLQRAYKPENTDGSSEQESEDFTPFIRVLQSPCQAFN